MTSIVHLFDSRNNLPVKKILEELGVEPVSDTPTPSIAVT